MIDPVKEDECCQEKCADKDHKCSCHYYNMGSISVLGNSRKRQRTEFQQFMNHLGNIFWIFFILALLFSGNTFLIWATLIAAIVFEEFD